MCLIRDSLQDHGILYDNLNYLDSNLFELEIEDSNPEYTKAYISRIKDYFLFRGVYSLTLQGITKVYLLFSMN